ncbi:hypothetical protein [Rhizobium sp. FKL33]|uniref:hypothetical protein n=1 Tax=Rhizobium sp. FKL33 TaxID=2562307 RepID=UPI0010C150AA|nr:hypothetical protein [Rhizobium sp. FKL33]
MLKYVMAAAILVPANVFAADTVSYETRQSVRVSGNCYLSESGDKYCVEKPLQRYTADCESTSACYHEQSGQHYTVQRPLLASE